MRLQLPTPKHSIGKERRHVCSDFTRIIFWGENMTAIETLQDGQRTDIRLRVIRIRSAQKQRRERKLVAEDRNGERVNVIFWTKHERFVDWIEERQSYRFEHLSVKDWRDSGGNLVLHSTQHTNVLPVNGGGNSPVQLLHMADTHVGYENRTSGSRSTVPWLDEIDCTYSNWDTCTTGVEWRKREPLSRTVAPRHASEPGIGRTYRP